MSSLWLRANGPQMRMLKIISGAVLNTAHHHPGEPVDRKFARGVAKRATGTISSQWGELLAAPTPSGAKRISCSSLRNGAQLLKPRGGRTILQSDPRLFRDIIREISVLIGPARASGDIARTEALIECLRIIDRVKKAHNLGSAS
jgi:hypothetical protein